MVLECNCAYYVDNWFYGYQTYCTMPTEYWLHPIGWFLLIIMEIIIIYFLLNKKPKD